MRLRIGCSGWFYSHWRGIFYPRQEPTTKNWFGYYANVFDTVELNAPFYRWPSAATVRRWRRDAPPHFVYSVKVNRRITHEQRMVRTRRLVASYQEIGDVLGDKMGCFLFQFPPSYRYTPSRLKSIVAQVGGPRRSAVEFRHRSWWREAAYRALEEAGIAFAAISAPRLPASIVPGQKRLYVRFSGPTHWYRHDYTPAELGGWLERIRRSEAEEAWIYFNNDHHGYAVKNALMLRRLAREAGATVAEGRAPRAGAVGGVVGKS